VWLASWRQTSADKGQGCTPSRKARQGGRSIIAIQTTFCEGMLLPFHSRLKAKALPALSTLAHLLRSERKRLEHMLS
jgi:hypothetical protein